MNNPLKTHDCGACGRPCATGVTSTGKKVTLDLKAKVWSLVGARPLDIVRTEMAMVEHADVCAYRDV